MCTAKFKPRVGPYLDEETFLSEKNNFRGFRRVQSTMFRSFLKFESCKLCSSCPHYCNAQVYVCTAKFKPRVGPYLDQKTFLSEENNFRRFRRLESTMFRSFLKFENGKLCLSCPHYCKAQVYVCTAKFKPRVGPYLDQKTFLSEENNFRRFRRLESTMFRSFLKFENGKLCLSCPHYCKAQFYVCTAKFKPRVGPYLDQKPFLSEEDNSRGFRRVQSTMF